MALIGSLSASRISSRVDDDGLRDAGDEVAALHLGRELLLERVGVADLHLDALGRLLADGQVVLALHVGD